MDGHNATPQIGLFATVIFALGMVATTLIVTCFYVESASTAEDVQCHDRVVSLSISNECPDDTFLEMHDDGSNGHYIICHCARPDPVIVQPGDGDTLENPTLDKKPTDVRL